MADNLSPVYQGDRSLWTFTTRNRDNSIRSLSGVDQTAVIVKLQRVDSPGTVIVGTGVAAIPSGTASQGILTYAPSANDVATVGTYWLWILIPWTTGLPQHSDPYDLEIKSAP